ncbi:HPP family protein [Tepidicaulis sp. LMO-SS28]|uniref:HPP family protein n=1 Tax=Tepidicaulis sp. LMO-SS28 TaxID=3447455 RepID=UPI003EDF633F
MFNRPLIRHFRRSEAAPPPAPALKAQLFAGLGAFTAIALCALLTDMSGLTWLMAPFGASCVLVFGLPESPLAQPRHVIGGHVIASLIGLICFELAGAGPAGLGLGVALALIAMLATRTVHPPAGADPLVFMAAGLGLTEGWPQLFAPVLAGSVLIVATGYVAARLAQRHYPTYWL